jgi:hypothetical protein
MTLFSSSFSTNCLLALCVMRDALSRAIKLVPISLLVALCVSIEIEKSYIVSIVLVVSSVVDASCVRARERSI